MINDKNKGTRAKKSFLLIAFLLYFCTVMQRCILSLLLLIVLIVNIVMQQISNCRCDINAPSFKPYCRGC